jgi:hypothetical protein
MGVNSELHNFLTLLSAIFMVVHVLAVWVDPFTQFGWNEVFIPFVSHYRPDKQGRAHPSSHRAAPLGSPRALNGTGQGD